MSRTPHSLLEHYLAHEVLIVPTSGFPAHKPEKVGNIKVKYY
jgi:hypothetical protein